MRTLRADLASAARDARDETRRTGGTGTSDVADAARSLGRQQLQQAEVLLNEFRSSMRAELRGQLSKGTVTSETVDLLKTQLDAVRQTITARLRG
jgi:hypothetical protein